MRVNPQRRGAAKQCTSGGRYAFVEARAVAPINAGPHCALRMRRRMEEASNAVARVIGGQRESRSFGAKVVLLGDHADWSGSCDMCPASRKE